ncbi:4'-phosphopantetheinyl transferase family protein [Zobellia uliginosa]|uniref:4'-phosphopantetheinyl transferase family protein n=1 Tax=Zobellia uliginosa TaxID=143224 RepID=UPI001C06E6F4|nr:4'-phosphopantetheinyl transferase superfamily protein [Zobellia uliginosa]MBU2945685.1 4'-phosphopantetheinyl transferase superfamily protein [Zobellia uliginosa]
MKLTGNDAHVWSFKVSDFDDISTYLKLLSLDEQERVTRFKFEKNRKTYILARGLLRVLSGRYLNVSPENIRFKYNDYGKPDYNLETSIKFNVSHSGELIVLAFVKNRAVGIDVEKIKTDFDALKLAENFFSFKEIEMLNDVPKNDVYKAFYCCWTRKESFIKAKGIGLSFPLASFTVSLKDENAELLRTDWSPQEKNKWKLFSFGLQNDYVGAITVSTGIRSVLYFNLEAFLTKMS